MCKCWVVVFTGRLGCVYVLFCSRVCDLLTCCVCVVGVLGYLVLRFVLSCFVSLRCVVLCCLCVRVVVCDCGALCVCVGFVWYGVCGVCCV